jgi:hypothetical protein
LDSDRSLLCLEAAGAMKVQMPVEKNGAARFTKLVEAGIECSKGNM